MIRLILGLGNPGAEYENTRHNAGRIAARYFAEKKDYPELKYDKKSNSLVSKSDRTTIALPETFMNKSGQAAARLIRPKKELKELVVIHDDLDVPLGRFKISYGKGAGGHKGVESVIRALKTKNFVRVRIGVSPKRKPNQREVMKFIVGKFKPAELAIFKKINKRVSDALEAMINNALEKTMSQFN